jgi:L-methionine (R)-S-oxide reductase
MHCVTGKISMVKKLQVYEVPSITVSFDPNVCRHSGACIRTLPPVFDPSRARWIEPSAATAEEIASAVQKCPSGALQYYLSSATDPAAKVRLARSILVNELARCMAESDTRSVQAGAVCAAIARARGYDFVAMYDVLPSEIAVAGWHGDPPVYQRFARENGLCGAAVATGQPQLVNDVTLDPRYLPTLVATRSELIVPVVDPATRRVVGTIDVASNRCDAFGGEDVMLMEACARVLVPLWTERS